MTDSSKPGLILQHGGDGPPGVFGEWLDERGIARDEMFSDRAPLPADPAGFGWVCTLGSDDTPCQPDTPEWVSAEIEFLRACVDADVPVLGLCFGGQALAAALGGDVVASEPPEVGWIEVATEDPSLVPEGPWLTFHYFIFEPPPGSEILAVSPAGPAAFRIGSHLGVQFHPEATPEIVAPWAEAEAGKLHLAGTNQEDFAREGVEHGDEAAAQARVLFDAWWELIRAG